MSKSTAPLWLLFAPLDFHEGEDDGGGGDDQSNNEGGNGDQGGTGDPDEPVVGTEDNASLLEALRRSRAQIKRFEKQDQDRRNKETAAELAEKGEIDKWKTLYEKEKERTDSLGSGYARSELNRAIEREAEKLEFIDTDDALQGVDRTQIEVEQDPEDPTKVVIDEASLKKAVKALADKKKHLLKTRGTDDGEPTGSSFGGGKRKSTGDKSAEMRKLYPNAGF